MRLSTTRVVVLAALVLALGGVMNLARQFIPGSTPSVVQAQAKGRQTLDAARLALDQANQEEKLNPTKETALAADAALERYNAALGALQGPLAPAPVFTPETEPNGTSATANVINLSGASGPCATVSAAISPGGDLDFFTFTGAPAGSRIWIETDTGGTQNAGATSRDTVIDLLAADGATVIENDDDDGTGNGGDGTVETGLASMIGGRTLTAGGTYFIRVRAFSATAIINPYRLFVTLTNVAPTPEVEANNTAATANPLVTAGTPTALASGSVSPAADSDYYSVVATAGNVVYFNVDADPERDGTGTDLVVEFRDPADVLLLSVDSSITGSLANPAAEGANFTIIASGTYFVRVRHFSATGTGTYHIMASACSSDPVGGGGGCTSITCPANVTQTNDLNQCGAVVNYAAPTPNGTCGTITCVPPSGSFFPVGTTTITCTSSAGPTCQFTVTVTDDQPPSITCPANVTVSNDPNQCGAVVNYPAPTITDNCPGTFTATCVPASGSFFPVGTTTVTCTVDGFRPPAVAAPIGPGCTTITHSSSQAITPLNSVSCNDGVGHTDNSYYRAFSLTSFGITGAFDVQSIDIGIEDAIAGGLRSIGKTKGGVSAPNGSTKKSISHKSRASSPAGGGQSITVNIFTSSMAFPAGFPGSLTMIGTATVNVADQSGTILNVPITGTAAAGSELVVEVFTPDGTAVGNLFFIGSNSAAETGPSYLRAADCGVTTPTTTAGLGFPDMHIVMNVNGCEQVVGGGSTCTFTVTVNDTQPPVITCPANVTAITDQNLCPAPACQIVNFTTTASDNCPGVVVVCNPPSGSCFPVGVTTVTCTATDASGNTATCSFTITTFDVALQDDANPANVLLWNSITGQYRFCCNGSLFTGIGKVQRQGCVYLLDHTSAVDKRVLGRVDKAVHAGTASLQSPPGTGRCTIQDRNTLNDTPVCQ
jgi:HYR domain-containing protein/pre-peptidase